jgi:hypothetical protein
LDSEPVRDDREEALLIQRHYQKLQSKRHLRESKLIFIPENNLGLESAHLDTMVHRIPGVQTYWQKNRPGVHKDGFATRGYQFLLTTSLAENSILFDEDCFTVTRERTVDDMYDMLQDQMLRYHWEKKKATDVHGNDRYALTGKIGNKQDDLLITMEMALYWGRAIYLGGQNNNFQ